jgi:hypothetical protein
MPKRPKSPKRAKPKPAKLPKVTEKQIEFLLMFRRLELELGRAPMLRELGEEAGYSEGSETAGAQRMMDKLIALGLAKKPEMRPVGGGTTPLGLAVLARLDDEE